MKSTDVLTVLVPDNIMMFKPVGATLRKVVECPNGFYYLYEGGQLLEGQVLREMLVIGL